MPGRRARRKGERMSQKKLSVKRITENPAFLLFILLSALFGVLFWRFVLGPYAYVYEDIGSDTFHINFPLYMMFSDFLHGEGYASYVLRAGLGMDISSYLYQYINPLNLLVVAAPARYLTWAVLFATYLKLLILGFAAYGLFRRLLKNEAAGIVSALLWTFSGYVTLWGQHYGFCMSLMLFTVFLLLVYFYIEDEEKSKNKLLVPWITLMLFTNYYFLYTSGIVGAAFLLVYLIRKREGPVKILKKLVGLGLMGILGILLGGMCLIPTLNIFLSSNRTASAVNPVKMMLTPYRIRAWITYVGRFFSNNTFGIQDYLATLNYYEAIMLSVGVLFLPGLVYLIRKKSTRRISVVLLALSLLMMAFPLTGQVLNLSLYSYRWSFFLCLLEAFVAGYFVREALEDRDFNNLKKSMLTGAVLAFLGFGFVVWGTRHFEMRLNRIYLVLYAVFFAVYLLLFLGGRRLARLHGKVFAGLLLGVLCLELAVSDFPTINFRQALTRHQMNQERYHDGAKEAYDEIRRLDASVYRVGRNKEAYINDSMAQGYPGMSVYLATNSKEAVNLKETLGGTGVSGNKIQFKENNYALWMLLGMKYLIADTGDPLPAGDYLKVSENGKNVVWQNTKALPFGYFYDSCWEAETVKKMRLSRRISAVLRGFYFTDEKSQTEYNVPAKVKDETVSLLNASLRTNQCSAKRTESGVLLTELGERKKKETDSYDPSVTFRRIGDLVDDGVLHELTLGADPDMLQDSVSMALYYSTGEDARFTPDRVIYFNLSPGHSRTRFLLPPGVTDLRVDVDTEVRELLITELSITNTPELSANYEKLRTSAVRDTSFAKNTYQATAENTSGHTQMLCIPLIFSQGWHALLDQEETALYNINGGLCGVEVAPGTHEVVLRYEIPHERAGILLTILGAGIYFLAFWILPFWKKKFKKSEKKKNNT